MKETTMKKKSKKEFQGLDHPHSPYLPYLIGDEVVLEVERYLGDEFEPDAHQQLADMLGDEAVRIYAKNDDFRKSIDRQNTPDLLYSFMRHWLASHLKKKSPTVYQKLPKSFGWPGTELPKNQP